MVFSVLSLFLVSPWSQSSHNTLPTFIVSMVICCLFEFSRPKPCTYICVVHGHGCHNSFNPKRKLAARALFIELAKDTVYCCVLFFDVCVSVCGGSRRRHRQGQGKVTTIFIARSTILPIALEEQSLSALMSPPPKAHDVWTCRLCFVLKCTQWPLVDRTRHMCLVVWGWAAYGHESCKKSPDWIFKICF